MVDFKNYISIDLIKDLKRIEIESSEGYEKDKDYYSKGGVNPLSEISDKVTPQLIKFLKDKNKESQFKKIRNSESHNSIFMSVWDKIRNDKELDDSDVSRFAYSFETYFSILMTRNSKKTVEETYEDIVSVFNSGNFKEMTVSDGAKCYDCGQNMKIRFKDWEPCMMVFDFSEQKDWRDPPKIVKPKVCMDKNNLILDVEFKSEELWVSDWFRIEEFTKFFNTKEYDKIDINTTIGKIESTKYNLDKGVISIHLGNSDPSILKKGDSLIFASIDGDKETETQYETIGSVCTDYWATTIVEKERLIEIVEITTKDKVKATEIVDKYFLENKDNIDVVKINPGKCKLEFSGFYWKFKNSDPEIKDDVQIYFRIDGISFKNEHKPQNKKIK